MTIFKPLARLPRLIAMLAAGGVVLAATQGAFAQRVRDYRNPNIDYSKVTPPKTTLDPRAPGGRTVTPSPFTREMKHMFRNIWAM